MISDDITNNKPQTVVICPLTSSLHPKWRSNIELSVQKRL
ncbi:MAG: hypothetical protein ACON4O_00955 [Lentimonas sp.]